MGAFIFLQCTRSYFRHLIQWDKMEVGCITIYLCSEQYGVFILSIIWNYNLKTYIRFYHCQQLIIENQIFFHVFDHDSSLETEVE